MSYQVISKLKAKGEESVTNTDARFIPTPSSFWKDLPQSLNASFFLFPSEFSPLFHSYFRCYSSCKSLVYVGHLPHAGICLIRCFSWWYKFTSRCQRESVAVTSPFIAIPLFPSLKVGLPIYVCTVLFTYPNSCVCNLNSWNSCQCVPI